MEVAVSGGIQVSRARHGKILDVHEQNAQQSKAAQNVQGKDALFLADRLAASEKPFTGDGTVLGNAWHDLASGQAYISDDFSLDGFAEGMEKAERQVSW
jgi:hypothetical protein